MINRIFKDSCKTVAGNKPKQVKFADYMKRETILFFAVILLTSGVVAMLAPGCANIVPPQGGPRDSLPPVLVKAVPGDESININSKRISFTFDEYIDVQNIFGNLIVSPIPKNNPDVSGKLNTVNIRLRDTLEPNTTYSLNFGDAIKDVNEGNVVKNFTYTFSTGSFIDSLELKGNVILAETGSTDTTLIVMLHTSGDDSAVVKQKPRYVTRLDSKGNFVFRHLPPATFYLYALKDEGGSYRYFDNTHLFAFADSAVHIGSQNDSITLYAFASPNEKRAAATTAPVIQVKNKNKNIVDTRLKYQTDLLNNQQDLLSPLKMTFETPLKYFDTSKATLYTDTLFTPVTGYTFQKDSSSQIVTLVTSWKENTLYHLILDKDFAEDSSGYKLLKTDTLSFTTKKKSDYGAVTLKFKNLDLAKNPVLQFVLHESIVKSFPLNDSLFTDPLFLPGEYQLRILYDENKNGVWDPGVFFEKHKQPERVSPIEKKVTIKANWKNEYDIPVN